MKIEIRPEWPADVKREAYCPKSSLALRLRGGLIHMKKVIFAIVCIVALLEAGLIAERYVRLEDQLAKNIIDGSGDFLSSTERQQLFEVLADRLHDPSSMQLRRLQRSKSALPGFVCGEVNAKNGFGGYVGFSPFTANLTIDKKEVAILKRDEVEKMTPELRQKTQELTGCAL